MISARCNHSGSPRNGALAGIEPSSLRSSRGRTVARLPVRLFSVQISGFHFQHFPCGFTEPTLALRCRAKPRHGSARARDGLDILHLLHSLPHPLHRLRGTLSLVPTAAKNRDRQSCIGRVPGTKPKMVARLRPTKNRYYGARLRLSPKSKALAPRGFARCKASAVVAATDQLSVASQATLLKLAYAAAKTKLV